MLKLLCQRGHVTIRDILVRVKTEEMFKEIFPCQPIKSEGDKLSIESLNLKPDVFFGIKYKVEEIKNKI